MRVYKTSFKEVYFQIKLYVFLDYSPLLQGKVLPKPILFTSKYNQSPIAAFRGSGNIWGLVGWAGGAPIFQKLLLHAYIKLPKKHPLGSFEMLTPSQAKIVHRYILNKHIILALKWRAMSKKPPLPTESYFSHWHFHEKRLFTLLFRAK